MKQNRKINQVFAMITDFGFDFSVASMKALILKEFPGAQIIDVDHSIKQFSVLSGALLRVFQKGGMRKVMRKCFKKSRMTQAYRLKT